MGRKCYNFMAMVACGTSRQARSSRTFWIWSSNVGSGQVQPGSPSTSCPHPSHMQGWSYIGGYASILDQPPTFLADPRACWNLIECELWPGQPEWASPHSTVTTTVMIHSSARLLPGHLRPPPSQGTTRGSSDRTARRCGPLWEACSGHSEGRS